MPSLYQSILLIDDDVDDQEIFLEALNEVYPNVHCHCESDSEVAISHLALKQIMKPDMLFIDMNMPKVNGKEFLKKIKSIDSLKGVPVIMFSTFFGESDLKEIRDNGAVHHMVKSTNFKDLYKSLQSILSKEW